LKLWADFYDYLLPDVPGCPFVAANHALRNSAILFCEQSLAWVYEHPDIAVVNDVDEYPYVPPAGALVHAVTYAEFNDKEIDASVKQEDMRIWNWRNQTGSPQYVLSGPTALTLVPKPDVEGTLKLIVALKPDNDATGIDDGIFQEYHGAIVHGALARLMLSPRKPYTNAELAAYHMKEFAAKTGSAGARVARNYTRAPLRTSIMNRR
jgi:hypothetical protein